VEIFLEEVDEALGRLFRSDDGAIAKDLHFIKGSALNIGLTEVSSICRSVETKLREAPARDADLRAIQTAFHKAKLEFASGALE
jgi:HPt (histidine-containing phosphotransfer) domain-containing protein